MSAQSAALLNRHARFTVPTIEGILNFTQRQPGTAFSYAYDPPPGEPRTNIVPDPRRVRIADARPIAAELSVDVQGFALVRSPTTVRDFWDEAQTLGLGHPEAGEIVKAATGASRVVVFDHTLRRRIPGAEDRGREVLRQPVGRVHVDQTVRSGPQRVRDIMGDQAEDLLRGRAAIINVWRPVGRPARDWPLALGDARTIAREDLIPSELRFRHRTGETYSLAYNPAQRWFFVPEMQTDEALLIKCWDSDAGVARFAPHSGFEDPTTPPGTPPRESIEFRTLAFFD
jgi:hypothetical protein